MRLAFSRPTADAAEQRALLSSFRAAGFDGLQLKGSQYQSYLQDPEHFQEEWGGDPGAVSALITGGTLSNEGIAALRQVISFARAVKSERVVFCHGIPRSGLMPADLREFARILADLGSEARESGVALSLHHHYNQPVMHREDFDLFFDAVPASAVGLTVDTAHLVKSGVLDIASLIRDLREVIDNIHLKDYADGDFRVLGEGSIDFDPVFTALREIGYQGWLCADEESGSAIQAGLEASFQFLQARARSILR
jgi:sugar phosphate isomerase/epimerase